VSKNTKIPMIYNLFPRHIPTIDKWSDSIDHIKEMGFNSIFINPFHETGFSGSLYAVKDYYKLNNLFLKKGSDPADLSPLKKFVQNCKKRNIHLIMDLVINHTAVDSVLTETNPQWFIYDESGKIKNPFAIDPANPGNVTVWGDLAIINNENREVWDYWNNLVKFYQELGIEGFRCDAAYQVPASLWEMLISSAKKRNDNACFYAETLGCQIDQIEALANAGFDYLFNSSKWWNFDQPWALDQHAGNKRIAPSISFPESHDTERLASLHPHSIEVQKQRYAFAAMFSEGIMIPMGYEYGAKTRMDVVNGTPDDVDKPKYDLSRWIKQINDFKIKIAVLGEEGNWRPLCEYGLPYLFLEKSSNKGNRPIFVCINKNQTGDTVVEEWMIPSEIKQCSKAFSMLESDIHEEEMPEAFSLDPADLVLFM